MCFEWRKSSFYNPRYAKMLCMDGIVKNGFLVVDALKS